MPFTAPSPNPQQQTAAAAPTTAARGVAATPPPAASSGHHGHHARLSRAFYFPNQNQRGVSSEVSNKQLPALPRDAAGPAAAAPGTSGAGPSAAPGGTGLKIANSGTLMTPAGHKKSSSSLSTISSAVTRTGDPGSEPVPPVLPAPPIPPIPTSGGARGSTSTKASPRPSSKPSPKPSLKPSAHSRSGSFQTRYMNMLLALDKIPRMHNILASFFTWILLAGFVIFPGSFTSPRQGVRGGEGESIVNDTLWVPLLGLSVSLSTLGVAGMAWLGLCWRHNYVWLLNRIYMPGTLNGLAGATATLTAVYAQHRGNWSSTALAAIVFEAAVFVICGVMFFFYNNVLLGKVKRKHYTEYGGSPPLPRTGCLTSIRESMTRIASKPSFAPGSVV